MTGHDESQRQAFVIGNAAIDEVFLVQDLPAQGESVLGRVSHTGLGGKGANQAVALSRTGVPTTLVAAIGTDWHGQRIREFGSRENLNTVLLDRPDLGTDRSIIFAGADGDNVIVTTHDCADSITVAEAMSALNAARPGDAVFLQGNLRADVTGAICREASLRGFYLVLNPSPFNPAFREFVQFADAIFVNESEAQNLTGHSRRDAVEALLHLGASQVVLTLGREGALFGSPDRVSHIPAVSAEVADVTGAGDCFEAVAVGSALLRSTHIDETALRHACRAAAHTVGSIGAVPSFPSSGQIAAFLSEHVAY